MNSIIIKSVNEIWGAKKKIHILMPSELSENTREETVRILANTGYLSFRYRNRRNNRTELIVASFLASRVDEFLARFMAEIYPRGEIGDIPA